MQVDNVFQETYELSSFVLNEQKSEWMVDGHACLS